MSAITYSLFGHKHSRVKWYRSAEGLMLAANVTKYFDGICGHVIRMIDGLKLDS